MKIIPPTPDFETSSNGVPDDDNGVEQVECVICGEPFSCRKMLEIHWERVKCEDQLPAARKAKKRAGAGSDGKNKNDTQENDDNDNAM